MADGQLVRDGSPLVGYNGYALAPTWTDETALVVWVFDAADSTLFFGSLDESDEVCFWTTDVDEYCDRADIGGFELFHALRGDMLETLLLRAQRTHKKTA
jgi:hypothetical protein